MSMSEIGCVKMTRTEYDMLRRFCCDKTACSDCVHDGEFVCDMRKAYVKGMDDWHVLIDKKFFRSLNKEYVERQAAKNGYAWNVIKKFFNYGAKLG